MFFNTVHAEIGSYGFTIANKDFSRPWGGVLVINENQAQAFANVGDQNNDTIPERPICEKVGIALIDGLGGEIQSSSWMLKKLKIN